MGSAKFVHLSDWLRHHTVLITAVLQEVLKSGSVSPLTWFFSVVLTVLGLFPHHENSRIILWTHIK